MPNLKNQNQNRKNNLLPGRASILALGSALCAAALVFYAKPISEFLVHALGLVPKTEVTEVIGSISSTTGTSYQRRYGDKNFSSIELKDTEVHHRDFLKTDRGAFISIELKTGDLIEIGELSQVFLEEWSPPQNQNPKIYLTVLRGDFRLIKSGRPGELLVVRERKVYPPKLAEKTSNREYVIHPDQPKQDIGTVKDDLSSPAPAPQETALNKPGKKMPEKIRLGDLETLSNQYVETVIEEKAPLFRRCQIIGLRDGKTVAGDLLISFTIQPSGGVRDVKVIQKSLQNDEMQACIVSVMERTRFRSYEGKSFSLSYPLTFR